MAAELLARLASSPRAGFASGVPGSGSASLQSDTLTATHAASCCTFSDGEPSSLATTGSAPRRMSCRPMCASYDRLTSTRVTASCTASESKLAQRRRLWIPSSSTTCRRFSVATMRLDSARAAWTRQCSSSAPSLARQCTSAGMAPSAEICSRKSWWTARLANVQSACIRTPCTSDRVSATMGGMMPACISGTACCEMLEMLAKPHAASSW
mmetsp:Transcript_1225/g.3956  ORF Transcript_1225/g.3956 Transcript_1225/m.3956 type:complete len:211 (-) Transcript_1225:435-1067(-)|eukprot:scaffold22420_cov124-Isochrysis_galbana.AAC.4